MIRAREFFATVARRVFYIKRLAISFFLFALELAGCRPTGDVPLDDLWMKQNEPWPAEGAATFKWEMYDASSAEKDLFVLGETIPSYRIPATIADDEI